MKDIETVVQEAVDAGGDSKEILDEALIKAMDVCTKTWKEGQMFMPEVLRTVRRLRRPMRMRSGQTTTPLRPPTVWTG